MTTRTWWCEAYGPPLPEYDSSSEGEWPTCFIEALNGGCLNHVRCAAAMTAERMRVFQRIQELAAAGDETGLMLAEAFTHPDQMLNASDGEPGGPEAGRTDQAPPGLLGKDRAGLLGGRTASAPGSSSGGAPTVDSTQTQRHGGLEPD